MDSGRVMMIGDRAAIAVMMAQAAAKDALNTETPMIIQIDEQPKIRRRGIDISPVYRPKTGKTYTGQGARERERRLRQMRAGETNHGLGL